MRIPPERCLCTGDVVAYGADPQATVDFVRDWGPHVVMGNCEESLALSAEDCGCGFEEGTTCATLARDWYAYANATLDRSARAWMAGLPRRIVFEINGVRMTAVHGGASAINRFIFPSTSASAKAAELELVAGDGIVAGHSGIPFSEIVGDRLWLNAGVIGLPANDGTPAVWYALMEPAAGGVRVSHHRLAYDHETAAAAMRAARLPEGYARALETGLWPSLDILPEAERAATGRPLRPGTLVFPPRRVTADADRDEGRRLADA